MMRISSAFPSKYLKASDIPDGREVHLKIDTVQIESMETTGDEKPVLYFIDREKGLVLNKTNADAIASVMGDDTDQWRGKPIILFATTTSFGGRTVPCLRVRVPRPSAPVEPSGYSVPLSDLVETPTTADSDVPF